MGLKRFITSTTAHSNYIDQTGPYCWRCAAGFYTRLGGTIPTAATLISHVMKIA